uniref:DNA mismatch repair proteins mutS family domain-containing protein n=1 Tax=Pseudobryopsis hainanensis TaxID=2320808 RepID=A0A386AXV3_9CHLO|nr:hypothetical protein [Pseudobryopsis hainanensis]
MIKELNPDQKGRSPLLEEYFLKKTEYPGYLIIMQVGKFYECYDQDAYVLQEKLGLKIASKGSTKMAGFPVYTLENYAQLLLKQNIKIVRIDQEEDKKTLDNKLVPRKVTAIYTPGTNPYNAEHISYLLTFQVSQEKTNSTEQLVNLAFVDLTVGELYVETLIKNDLKSFINKIQPVEILASEADLKSYDLHMSSVKQLTVIPEEAFDTQSLELINTGLETQAIPKPQIRLIGSIVWYCFNNQFMNLNHLHYCGFFNSAKFMKLEDFTIMNLELFNPLRPSGCSLFQVLNKTKTPMGARQLEKRLLFPSCDKKLIESQLDWVEFFKDQTTLRAKLQELLKAVGDLTRMSSRACWESRDPKHVLSLAESLTQVNNIKELLTSSKLTNAIVLGDQLATCPQFTENVFNILEPQNPFETGTWVKYGVCEQLDQLKSSGIIEKREQLLIELTHELGFRPKLAETKGGWVCEFTYYQSKKLDSRWQIQLSSKKKVKCSHPLIQQFEHWYQKTGRAISEQIEKLEFREYLKLVHQASTIRKIIQTTAEKLADIDVSVALAEISQQYNYTRPVMVNKVTCSLKGARHPVLEQQVDYIANNCFLGQQTETPQILIITGANMGGKSAFVRQVALISIMAQIGSFVPAEQAILGIRHSIFVRVGGFDNLALNQSTFMVEMAEVASILNELTPRSLVVLDEIGRGTSFVDGFSLACAILEHLHNHSFGPHVLCTTHFSELTQFTENLSRCQNFTMQSSIKRQHLYHSYRLVPGVCQNSLGVETAESARMPESVLERARYLRSQLLYYPARLKNFFEQG